MKGFDFSLKKSTEEKEYIVFYTMHKTFACIAKPFGYCPHFFTQPIHWFVLMFEPPKYVDIMTVYLMFDRRVKSLSFGFDLK